MTKVLRQGRGKLPSYRERFGYASGVEGIWKHEGKGMPAVIGLADCHCLKVHAARKEVELPE